MSIVSMHLCGTGLTWGTEGRRRVISDRVPLVINPNVVRRVNEDGGVTLTLPYFGYELRLSSRVSSFLASYDGPENPPLESQHELDLEQELARNYILLRASEVNAISEGLTKPVANPVGAPLDPRSIDDIKNREICIFGAPIDTACVAPFSPVHGPDCIRSATQLRLVNERCGTRDLGNVVRWPNDGLGVFGARVSHLTRGIINAGGIPLMLGGDHSITYYAIQGIVDSNFDEKVVVVHFDAHNDLAPNLPAGWPRYMLNHASVMSYVVEFPIVDALFQLGLREESLCDPPLKNIKTVSARELESMTLSNILGMIPNMPVYVSIDMDVLDPSVAPEVTTPLPNGLTFNRLSEIISALYAERHIIGMDIVEVCATSNAENSTAMFACELLKIATKEYYE